MFLIFDKIQNVDKILRMKNLILLAFFLSLFGCHEVGTETFEAAPETATSTTGESGGGGGSSQSQVFSYIGADQSFTIPAGIISIRIKAWGAGGGGGTDWVGVGGPGGAGAYAEAILAVTPGEVLTIVVGKGGESGLNPPADNGYMGGRGGGYSGIFRGAVAIGNALLVAAGGGGGSSNGNPGGAGGDIIGENGGGGAYAGSPGTQVAGGAGGIGTCCWNPQPGDALCGGSALGAGCGDAGYSGGGSGGPGSGNAAGGGGGAGYYGGGGGGYGGGSGGGGSSFVTGTSTVLEPGIGVTPGNVADPDRSGAAVGGARATNGGDGIFIVEWSI